MQRYRIQIAGQFRDSAQVEVVRSPYDGAAVAEIAVANERDIDDAITTTHDAFSRVRELPTHTRAELLEQVSNQLRTRKAQIAELIARESGKPIRYARAEVDRAVLTFSLGASECRRLGGEVLPIDQLPGNEGRLCLYRRVPRGAVGAISPFNFPLNLVAHKLSPAFAVGASVILKPPPQAPLTSHVLGEIFAEAGLTAGALNIVHCPPNVAERIVRDDRIAVLSFTGSDRVGWHLKSVAGKKQVILELGGNAPCVIDEDTNLEKIMPRLLEAAWANAGQVCIRAQRFFVHAARYDEFLERFVTETNKVPCGDPLDEKTVVGPLIEKQHVERVQAWIQEAVASGATLRCGGEVDRQIIRPAVLTETKPEMRVCKDEVFGPVVTVEPFSDFAQALELCNQTRFGLQAGIFTNDVQRALRAFNKLEYGGVLINDAPIFRVDNYPYGGSKDSGFGREGVRFAMEEMTELRTLVFRQL